MLHKILLLRRVRIVGLAQNRWLAHAIANTSRMAHFAHRQ